MKRIEKPLPEGSVIHGNIRDYIIVRAELQDGFGINYMARSGEELFLIREFFMYHCCERDADGVTMLPDGDSESTVDDFREAFDRLLPTLEASAEGQPSLARVEEWFHLNNTTYLVLEYLSGPTLYEYVMKHGPVSVDESRRILTPVFLALRRLHTHHLLHTDLSPQSIVMVTEGDGRVRPVLKRSCSCKPFINGEESAMHLPPVSCPVRYTPLEQSSEMDKFLPQTNVYAASAILFFILSGKEPPAASEATPEILRGMLPDHLPHAFVTQILKGMSRDWHDRQDNMSDLRISFLTSLEDAQETMDYVPEEQVTVEKKKSHERWTVLIISIILAVCTGALVWLMVSIYTHKHKNMRTRSKEFTEQIVSADCYNGETLITNSIFLT